MIDIEDIFIYTIDLPIGVNEMVTPNEVDPGYSIYINARLNVAGQQLALAHAMHHIINRDFEKDDIDEIESAAHRR